MSHNIDDKLLHNYLRGDSEFSQHYKNIETDEVPAELDTFVVAQATQNLAAKKTARQSQWRKWSAPLAMAATIIVTVSIVMQSNVTSPSHSTLDEVEQAPAMRNELVVEKDSANTSAAANLKLDSSKEKSVIRSTARLAAKQAEAKQEMPTRGQPSTSGSIAASTSGLIESSDSRRDEAKREKSDVVIVTQQQLSGFSRKSEPPTETSSIGDLSKSPPTPSQSPKLERALELKPSDKASSANEFRQRGASIPPAGPAAPPAAQASATTRAKANEGLQLEEVIVTGAFRRRSANDAALPIGVSIEAIQAREANPEAWLKYIRDLRFDGQLLSAGNEWKRFREAYPDFPVADNDGARMK